MINWSNMIKKNHHDVETFASGNWSRDDVLIFYPELRREMRRRGVKEMRRLARKALRRHEK